MIPCLSEEIVDRSYTRLFIDNQQIYLTDATDSDLPPSLRYAISELEHFKGDNFYALRIWAGKRKYELSSNSISVAELDWLAYELGDWLDLPITETSS